MIQILGRRVGLVGLLAPLLLGTLSTLSSAQVVTWGDNSAGQRTLPAGFVSATQIAAGWQFAVAVKSDGTVSAWGSNAKGKATPPVGLANVIQAAAGKQHALAVRSDGSVVCWGSNDYGQANFPANLTGVTQVSAGDLHSVALKSDGTVIARGSNTYGQTNVPAGLTNVKQVAAGGFFNVALKKDGTVTCWGDNSFHECEPPAGLADVVQVAAGRYFALALKSNGNVVGWGSNDKGQLTIPGSVANVKEIACGDGFAVARLSSGVVKAWGDNKLGQSTVPLDNPSNVAHLVAGTGFAMMIATPRVSLSVTDIYAGSNDWMYCDIKSGGNFGKDTQYDFVGTDAALIPAVTFQSSTNTSFLSVRSKAIEANRIANLSVAFKGGEPTVVPITLRMNILNLVTTTHEVESGTLAAVTVTFSRGVREATSVKLSCDHPELLSLPSTVTFKPATLSRWYGKIPTKAVTADVPITITATFGNQVRTLTILLYPAINIKNLTVDRTELTATDTLNATVTISSPARKGGYLLSYGGVLYPISSTSFSQGSTAVTFKAKAIEYNNIVTGHFSVSHGSSSAEVTVTVNPIPLSSLSITPLTVRGRQSATGVVGFAPFSPTGAEVTLTSSDPFVAKVPSTIKADSRYQFNIQTFKVTAITTVTITATCNGATKTATLTIKP